MCRFKTFYVLACFLVLGIMACASEVEDAAFFAGVHLGMTIQDCLALL
jgi:hypothetical protein